jgi:uncharacterized membrane protein
VSLESRRTSNAESRGADRQALHDAPGESPQRSASNGVSWTYSIASLVALVGLADAIYLTIEHLTGQSVRCTITTGCDEVLSSSYASIRGIPLAAFGALAYFTAFSLATLAAFGYQSVRPVLRCLVALMFLMALWLLYVHAFVLRAFCQYCLLSAAVTLSLSAIVALAWRQKRG